METTLTKLTVLPMTREEIKSFVDRVATEVNNGDIDPIKLAVHLKSIEETIKTVKAHYVISDAITEGAEDYSEKKFEAFGAEITKASRTTYNYSICNDPVHDKLVLEFNDAKALIKAREGVLQTGLDPATGEQFTKPIPLTSNYLTIKLK